MPGTLLAATASRRAALTALGATAAIGATAAAGALSGCTTYGTRTTSTAPTTHTTLGGPVTLGTTSEIPVGGGKVFTGKEVVVTQPTKGVFKCFTAVCTHQGCLVNDVSGGTINCPCHGSKYSIKDGSVVVPPAPRPLAAEPITVNGDSIVLNT
jgi:Rieske Fe-S protein